MILLDSKLLYKSYKNKYAAMKAVKILSSSKLLPLHASKNLSSIVGHLIGDGNLSKNPFVGDFRFYGTEIKLNVIRKKIFRVFRIRPKQFYRRKGGFVLKYNNCLMSRILNAVGVPRGNKVNVPFRVPSWIMCGSKPIKRAFLIAICDDELSSPRIDKRGYIEPLRLTSSLGQALSLLADPR